MPPLPTLGFLESYLWVLLIVLLFVAFSSLGIHLHHSFPSLAQHYSTSPESLSPKLRPALFVRLVRHAVRQIMTSTVKDHVCFGDLHSLTVCVSKTTVTSPLTRSDNPWIQ